MSKFIKLDNEFNSLVYLPLGYFLAGSAAATAGNHPAYFFRAPYPGRIISVAATFGTASSSGTLTFKKAASGTATSSGTAILTSTMSLAGTANTEVAGVIDSTNAVLNTGDWLGAFTGGTLTSLADLGVMLMFRPIRNQIPA